MFVMPKNIERIDSVFLIKVKVIRRASYYYKLLFLVVWDVSLEDFKNIVSIRNIFKNIIAFRVI